MPTLIDAKECRLCPRTCGVRRDLGSVGYCRMPDEVIVGRAALHLWEEPCLSGKTGSGTVFFSGCSLKCIYCQNYNLSAGQDGKKITGERLTEIFLELQDKGAQNINLVTPTHYLKEIIPAIERSRHMGLHIPMVYNTGGYERTEIIKELDGYIDIYLTDFKYFESELAQKYSRAGNYFEYAAKALEEMVRQIGHPIFDQEGQMRHGVIVRHLLLPGCLMDAKKILKYVHTHYGDQVYFSLMNQYTPLASVADMPELNQRVRKKSYDKLIQFALELGVSNAYIQEGETAKESFIPLFDGQGV